MRKLKPKQKWKIALTYPISKKIINEVLAPHATITKNLKSADAVLTLLTDRVDQKFLDSALRLKVIGNIAVGYDNIDLALCKERGIRVVNTPGVLTRATAELTIALLFATARRICEGSELCRSGRWRGWDPSLLIGLELKGRKAVILGRGRIGKETGKMMKALGLQVDFITQRDSYSTITRKLKEAQIFSIHVPINSSTRHWLDAKRIALLPRDCIVINTARGAIIDEAALTRALAQRKIFGAGLDVYEFEPKISANLRKLANVTLLPHIGSATHKTREDMARLAAQGVITVLNGRRPKNLVL